jgi:hypothetical protein
MAPAPSTARRLGRVAARALVWFLAVLPSLPTPLRAAENLEVPREYEITDAKTGRLLATVWGWTEPVTGDPSHVVAVSQTLFARGGEWRVKAIFSMDTPPRCLSWEGTSTDAQGGVIVSTHTRWVPEVFPMLTAPFPPGTYPMEAPLGFVLTRLGLSTVRQASFHTVFGGTLAQIDLWIDGRETVHVPAGDFDCHRVRMRANAQTLFPNLPAFLRPVLSFFIPTYTLWLTVNEPQRFVQFVGQMGPPGSPELRVRLLTREPFAISSQRSTPMQGSGAEP